MYNIIDWMTEHFDSYPHSTSTESSPGSSVPPSPLEHDVQVPSDLEIMTSLLKEELAQLEDYYLFESTPMKVEKWPKCDKGYQAMATSSYYQLPSSSHNVNQCESNPRLVTLTTGERDLKGICGSSVVKTSRPAPYSYVRTHSTSQRIASNGCKDVEVFEKETWTFKGTHSGYAEMGLDPCAVDRIFAKNHTGTKKVRECAILLKEEEKRCFTEDVFYRAEMVKSFDAGAPINVHHKREGQFHGMKMLGHGHESVPMPVLHCSENGSNPAFKHPGVAECYFSQISSNLDPYLGFVNEVDQSVRTGPVESQNMGYSNHECLVDQSFEYLSGDSVGSSLEFPVQKPMQRLRENLGAFKQEVKVSCFERSHGERKQKKRDQNKTAAYRQEEQNNADLHHLCYRNNTRYRQRKRAEQDCLEEELHGLEGRNRELRDKAESVEREIQYVKDLLIEVYKARSQRLKEDFST